MNNKRKIPDDARRICHLRDEGRCQWKDCTLSKANGDRMNLHHIQNEQFGGTENPHNLITLCDIHHKAMHVEFSAFYPDSEGVLWRMNHRFRRTISRLRLLVRVDDAYDLKPYLYYLTKSKKFRDGQLEAIRASLKGKDVLLVTPTGTGKSVCYQLPGMLSLYPSLVISPLKALMVDQVRSVWSKMLPATYINSDLGSEEKKKRYEFISKHLYKFIYAAPERFFSSGDPDTYKLYGNYSYLVIDEAHSIDSWGIAFRPSYRRLGELRDRIDQPPVIALTATASKATQKVILESLGIPNAKVIVTGFYKDNIAIHKYSFRNGGAKLRFLSELLAEASDEKTLLFVPTIKEGNLLLDELRANGSDVNFYHGKLDTKTKMDLQSRFTGLSEPRITTLISTSAFGMGIDIPDIRLVIHWMPALSLTEYTQQIGRAGRDGKRANAYLLYEKRDDGLLKFLAKLPTTQQDFKVKHGYSDHDVRGVVEKLQGQVEDMLGLLKVAKGDEWEYILDYFGESPMRFWTRYGKLIVDSIILLAFVAILCALLT